MNTQPSAAQLARTIQDNIAGVMVGKEPTIQLLLVALSAGGHVLLEDVPGTGKTIMAKSLAKSLDVTFRRIQFTPDLLPTDVTGVSYYNQKLAEFEFRPGPVFTHILLADEINRATPRTQSALLEAMEERQVTTEGVTRLLPEPFLVIATQNPVEQEGTFPLPEAQLDRFLLKLPVGYPSAEEEVAILDRFGQTNPYEQLKRVATAEDLLFLRQAVPQVYVSPAVRQYMVDLVRYTRSHSGVALGVSPRGTLALFRSCQALAALRGRSYVLPDDVQQLSYPVLMHRIVASAQSRLRGDGPRTVLENALDSVAVPVEEGAQAGGGGV